MSDIIFEWDEKKSQANKRLHNVSFEDARTVFLDENAIRFFDPDHSENEDRFLMIRHELYSKITYRESLL